MTRREKAPFANQLVEMLSGSLTQDGVLDVRRLDDSPVLQEGLCGEGARVLDAVNEYDLIRSSRTREKDIGVQHDAVADRRRRRAAPAAPRGAAARLRPAAGTRGAAPERSLTYCPPTPAGGATARRRRCRATRW